MEPFTLALANGAILTGLTNLPDTLPTDPKYKPLMVGLHGGSYSSAYFDVDNKHTASLASNALGIPWVGIDRPGYQGSTSFYPIPEGSSFPETYGDWLHVHILPAVWKAFGEPRGCNSMVLHCHSLGAPGAVIAAATLTKEAVAARQGVERPIRPYPLSGIIISGFGTQTIDENVPAADAMPEFFNFHPKVKDALMMPEGTSDPSIYEHTVRLNNAFPSREVRDIRVEWLPRFRTDWAPYVRIPVMIGIAERDIYWKGTEEHVRDFAATFTGSPRVDGSVIRGAPHNLEMSYWAQGWYARCFGFGLESATSFALAEV